VVVLVLTNAGDVRARLDLPEGELVRVPLVRARSREAVVVYTRLTETSHQVHVAGLVCE
jgi:hypothetical protein